MGFRTVVVKSRSKLETRLNYLVVRGEEERKIFLQEINTLIVQSTAVSLTAALINELTKRNIKVIFCDEKNNPSSELIPYYGSRSTVKKYREQFCWSEEMKQIVWQVIVKRKIKLQSEVLSKYCFEEQANILNGYCDEVCVNDETNREGHAAKVYFNCLLGDKGSRRRESFLNGCLNYGYAVVLAEVNRTIAAAGYLTQIGIWHVNEFNEFNLGCDLMEIFRPYVDRTALSLQEDDEGFKKKMIGTLSLKTIIDGQTTTLDNAIRIFVMSFFRAMSEEDASLLILPQEVLFEDEL
ncbi:MAG: type II CRISPR-associated endonuclease Cas1 [Clostridia bacterium]|nr:type II CRISPR-associated endonuclease Cas1 [Clostridia bacterium]